MEEKEYIKENGETFEIVKKKIDVSQTVAQLEEENARDAKNIIRREEEIAALLEEDK